MDVTEFYVTFGGENFLCQEILYKNVGKQTSPRSDCFLEVAWSGSALFV